MPEKMQYDTSLSYADNLKELIKKYNQTVEELDMLNRENTVINESDKPVIYNGNEIGTWHYVFWENGLLVQIGEYGYSFDNWISYNGMYIPDVIPVVPFAFPYISPPRVFPSVFTGGNIRVQTGIESKPSKTALCEIFPVIPSVIQTKSADVNVIAIGKY